MSDEIAISSGESQGGEQPVVITEMFSGPVPHPSVLEHYKAVDPEFPMMLMGMATKQLDHRIEVERQKLDFIREK
jgi:uncharacterized membrane protein